MPILRLFLGLYSPQKGLLLALLGSFKPIPVNRINICFFWTNMIRFTGIGVWNPQKGLFFSLKLGGGLKKGLFWPFWPPKWPIFGPFWATPSKNAILTPNWRGGVQKTSRDAKNAKNAIFFRYRRHEFFTFFRSTVKLWVKYRRKGLKIAKKQVFL